MTNDEFKNYLSSIENAKRRYGSDEDTKKFDRLNRGLIRYNRSPQRGALNIYPIQYVDKETKKEEILIAVSLSFPYTQLQEHEASIPYQVNSVHSRLEGVEDI